MTHPNRVDMKYKLASLAPLAIGERVTVLVP
jgi:hypothetical protein